MNDPQPFLQLTLPRVGKTLKRLEQMIWRDPRPVSVSFAGCFEKPLSCEEASRLPVKPVTLPFHWGKLMRTGWFKLELPEAEPGETRWLRWVDQGEGTLMVNGVPSYGFDVAHRTGPLPDGVSEAWVEGLCLQSGIWHPEAKGLDTEGSRLSAAEVVERDDLAWTLFHRMDTLFDLVKDESARSGTFAGVQQDGIGHKPAVEVVSPLLRRLLRLLDDAAMAFDAGGLRGLEETLDKVFDALRGGCTLTKGLLTGHAHIDLVWLWTESCAEYKTRHTFATMDRLMDLYPEFHFAYSQSASYDSVSRAAPALMERVKSRIKEGRWEAVGATYVESDTLLACGEGLTRSFLLGQEAFRDQFGESSTLLWLPDVFGYCGCLPQIMRQCGVTRFFTTKLTWSNINLFPYSSFRWRGADGSEVLTHVTQGLGYNQNAWPGEVRKAADEYRQSDVHDEFLLPTGFGDGGGGVTPEMCERARCLADLAGVPQTCWGRLEDFYDRLEEVKNSLPVYQGELTLEYHRGTFTAHSDLKRDFRALERALQIQEAVYALHGRGAVDPQAWKRLVFAQFHDYIPGSSVWEVYEEGLPELRELAREAMGDAQSVAGKEGDLLLNPLPLPRPVYRDGRRLELPPLSVTDPEAASGTSVSLPVRTEGCLKSERVEVTFTDCGEIEGLSVDGSPVALQSPANQLVLFSDFPHQFDMWDIDRQTLQLGQPVESGAEEVDWEPPEGRSGVAFRRKLGESSSVEIRYSVDTLHPLVHVELAVDWREENCLLKAQFPTGYQGRLARYGSPYGSALRGQLPGESKDEASFEVCGSRWAVVMDDAQQCGLSLVTEAKYGFSCREGNLGLSLLRSVEVTGEDSQHQQVISPSLRPGGERERFSDHGTHTLRYALGAFHAAGPREENPAALAENLYAPVLRTSVSADGGFSGLKGGESLIPCWAKPLADGGWVLRLHETLGVSGQAEVMTAPGWRVRRTTLSESEFEELRGPLSFRPYEIVSLHLLPDA